MPRCVIGRGDLSCPADFTPTNTAFIDDFIRTIAKPFRWTDQGRSLPA